jgi:hypothetical protein
VELDHSGMQDASISGNRPEWEERFPHCGVPCGFDQNVPEESEVFPVRAQREQDPACLKATKGTNPDPEDDPQT